MSRSRWGTARSWPSCSPSNALNQLGLGYDAANSRQYPQAVKALEAYLKLAPDSQQTAQVKALVTQLKALAASGTVPGHDLRVISAARRASAS